MGVLHMKAILFGIALLLPQAAHSYCSSVVSNSDSWRRINSAPRDGRWVEVAQTYGVMPWYGLFHWTNIVKLDNGYLLKTSFAWRNGNRGLIEDSCLFWRPTKQTPATYVDPTNGEQLTNEYWLNGIRHALHAAPMPEVKE